MFSKLLSASVFVLLLICLSCSKKIDDPNPSSTISQLIIGTWKFQSAVGSATVASKKIDLASDLELTDKTGNTQTFKKTVAWVFSENGKGTQDGVAFTYKIEDKTIIITKANKIFSLTASVNNNQLDITETETGIKSILEDYNALLLTTNAVTAYNRTQSYKSLADILATNGTPGCLVKTITSIAGDTKNVREYTYNDENKVIAVIYKTTDLLNNTQTTNQYRYEEERSNLGSDTKPSIKIYINNQPLTKLYCDKNGRVNRMEIFGNSSDKYPNTIITQEYDSNNNHIKSDYAYYDTQTGEKNSFFIIYNYEYSNGNLSKSYSSHSFTPKYLSFEVTAWTPEVRKTKSVYLFNYGNVNTDYNQNNYPLKRANYNSLGNPTLEYNYTYTFDSKGYLLTEKTITAHNSKIIDSSTYEYFSCK